jgi:predicted nucleic acid-binding protein
MKPETLVWDSSGLVAAIRADRLDVLGTLVSKVENVTTAVVESELKRLELGSLSRHSWLQVVQLDELDEFDALLRWSDRMGASEGHNRGESTVFAWAEVHAATPIIDDKDARQVARAYGLATHGTLWMFAEAINSGVETEKSLAGLIDTLMTKGEARYPFATGEDFGQWARANRMLR